MSCKKDNWCIIKTITVYPEITNVQYKEQPFLDWTNLIEFKEDKIYLPDGTIMDGIIWMNNQQQFDNGSYTKFLTDYYYNSII